MKHVIYGVLGGVIAWLVTLTVWWLAAPVLVNPVSTIALLVLAVLCCLLRNPGGQWVRWAGRNAWHGGVDCAAMSVACAAVIGLPGLPSLAGLVAAALVGFPTGVALHVVFAMLKEPAGDPPRAV